MVIFKQAGRNSQAAFPRWVKKSESKKKRISPKFLVKACLGIAKKIIWFRIYKRLPQPVKGVESAWLAADDSVSAFRAMPVSNYNLNSDVVTVTWANSPLISR